MSANLGFLVIIGVLVSAGVYLLIERSITRMLLGLLLFGNGINLLILTSGGRDGNPPSWAASPFTSRWPTRWLRR